MKKILFVLCLAVIASVAMYGTADAISGTCSGCHTMHNSQGGVTQNGQVDGRDNLLKGSCIACHTTASALGPRVDSDKAGGNFNQDTDAEIHNVDLINTLLGSQGADSPLGNNPPGGSALGGQLGCSGTDGCHGDPSATKNTITGFHHSPPAGMYRFLYADSGGSNIVTGEGDADWEGGAASSTNHNIYASDTTNGISTFCARCHGGFHGTANTGNASPFTRHPTENDVTGDSATVVVNYEQTPFAFAPANFGSVSPTTAYTATNAKVMCLSCHKTHGSAYADLLRFDYTAIDVGSGTNDGGCENCHYSKM